MWLERTPNVWPLSCQAQERAFLGGLQVSHKQGQSSRDPWVPTFFPGRGVRALWDMDVVLSRDSRDISPGWSGPGGGRRQGQLEGPGLSNMGELSEIQQILCPQHCGHGEGKAEAVVEGKG